MLEYFPEEPWRPRTQTSTCYYGYGMAMNLGKLYCTTFTGNRYELPSSPAIAVHNYFLRILHVDGTEREWIGKRWEPVSPRPLSDLVTDYRRS